MRGWLRDLPLAARIARRELRGGIKGFRIFLACLTLGVAAVAGVGSMTAAVTAGLQADARKILGGDADLRLVHQPASAEQVDWLRANARQVAEIVGMRAMARRIDGAAQALVELKAVDGAYPLYPGFALEGGMPLAEALAQRDGDWGAAVEPRLMEKLGIAAGDAIRVGDGRFVVRAAIAAEPDRTTGAFTVGPRLMVSLDGLRATGLIQPGSLIQYHYRIALAADADLVQWRQSLEARFPDAGWRISDIRRAAPGIERFVDRVNLFLTLIGLTALVVGGVGVGNAVRGFLAARANTIATLKCLGAPGRLIFQTYLLQILALGTVGILLGLVLGAGVPLVGAPLFADHLPVAARFGIYPLPLLLAALFGLLTVLAFSLWPLGQARDLPAGALFRSLLQPVERLPSRSYLVATAVAALLLAGVAVVTADRPSMAAAFVAGAAVTLLLFLCAARLAMRAARAMPRLRRVSVRLALANLHRPGAPTAGVVLSLGLGLTVLVAVALVQGNLARQVGETMPHDAPSYYFIDVQSDQIDDFQALLRDFHGVRSSAHVPMLRGRIVAMKDVPVSRIEPPADYAWVLRGDRGITWAAAAPAGNAIVAGEWWPADHAGPPQVSFDAAAAAAFGLTLGDSVTVNLLGREIRATITSLREIDWDSLAINFLMVFSPDAFAGAPTMELATAHVAPEAEAPLERAVVERFPNVSAIRVREVLENVASIVADLGIAVRAIATVAIVAGTLVLAGAIAATHRRRVGEAVILKVLGATRRDVLAAYALEFALLGLLTATIAGAVGTAAGWAVVRHVMQAQWTFLPQTVVITAALCAGITLAAGLLGTWRALGQRPAALLRNE